MKPVLPEAEHSVQAAQKNNQVVAQEVPVQSSSESRSADGGGKKKRGAKKKRNKGKSKSLDELNQIAMKDFRKYDVEIPETLLKDPKLAHHQDIKYGRFLGFGSYGDVVQATHSGGGHNKLDVACKKMNQTDHMNLKKFIEVSAQIIHVALNYEVYVDLILVGLKDFTSLHRVGGNHDVQS